MPLKMRPTGLGHGVYKDVPDYGIFCGEWCIGRIYETRTGPADLRWFWALHAPSRPGNLRTSNHAATLEMPRPSSRRVGSSGRRGRGWRRSRKPQALNKCNAEQLLFQAAPCLRDRPTEWKVGPR